MTILFSGRPIKPIFISINIKSMYLWVTLVQFRFKIELHAGNWRAKKAENETKGKSPCL